MSYGLFGPPCGVGVGAGDGVLVGGGLFCGGGVTCGVVLPLLLNINVEAGQPRLARLPELEDIPLKSLIPSTLCQIAISILPKVTSIDCNLRSNSRSNVSPRPI